MIIQVLNSMKNLIGISSLYMGEVKPTAYILSLNGVTLMFTGGTIDFENNSIECNLIENNGNN